LIVCCHFISRYSRILCITSIWVAKAPKGVQLTSDSTRLLAIELAMRQTSSEVPAYQFNSEVSYVDDNQTIYFEDLTAQAQEAIIDLIVSIIKNKKIAEQEEE